MPSWWETTFGNAEKRATGGVATTEKGFAQPATQKPEELFTCPICGATFATEAALAGHVEAHAKEEERKRQEEAERKAAEEQKRLAVEPTEAMPWGTTPEQEAEAERLRIEQEKLAEEQRLEEERRLAPEWKAPVGYEEITPPGGVPTLHIRSEDQYLAGIKDLSTKLNITTAFPARDIGAMSPQERRAYRDGLRKAYRNLLHLERDARMGRMPEGWGVEVREPDIHAIQELSGQDLASMTPDIREDYLRDLKRVYGWDVGPVQLSEWDKRLREFQTGIVQGEIEPTPTAYGIEYTTPGGWLIDDDQITDPEGNKYTPEEAKSIPGVVERLQAEFSETDVREMADFAEASPEAFVAAMRQAGDTPLSRAVLQEMGLKGWVRAILPEPEVKEVPSERLEWFEQQLKATDFTGMDMGEKFKAILGVLEAVPMGGGIIWSELGRILTGITAEGKPIGRAILSPMEYETFSKQYGVEIPGTEKLRIMEETKGRPWMLGAAGIATWLTPEWLIGGGVGRVGLKFLPEVIKMLAQGVERQAIKKTIVGVGKLSEKQGGKVVDKAADMLARNTEVASKWADIASTKGLNAPELKAFLKEIARTKAPVVAEKAIPRVTEEVAKVPPKAAEAAPEAAAKVAEEIAPVVPKAQEALMSMVKAAESVGPAYEAIKTVTRGRRVVAAKAASEAAGGGQAGFLAAMEKLGGKIPPPDFISDIKLIPEHMDELHRTIQEVAKTSFDFDVARAGTALEKLFMGQKPQPKELELLERIFGPELTGAIEKINPSKWELMLDIMGIPRSIQTMMDLSAWLRQGAVSFWKNPKKGIQTVGMGGKAFASKRWASELDDYVRSHKLYDLASSSNRKAEQRLILPEIGGVAKVAKREEPFQTRFAQRIPGLKQSERAYVGMINKFRIDHFATEVNRLQRLGVVADDTVAGTLAEWINITSGRGNLGRLNAVAPAMNQLLYSSRLQISRIQMPYKWARLPAIARKLSLQDLHMRMDTEIWAGLPESLRNSAHAQLGKLLKGQKWDKITRKKGADQIRALVEAASGKSWDNLPANIKDSTIDAVAHFFAGPNWQIMPRELMRGAIFDLVRWFTATSAIIGGGAWGLKVMGEDAKVELNPLSSDFGKLRAGNVRIDLGAGMVQWIRFFTQFLTGVRKSTETGGYSEANRAKLIQTFTRTKAAPVPAFITDLLFGETVIGEELEGTPAGIGKIAKERLLPMALNDFMDAFEEEGWIGLAYAAPALFGAGIVAYHREAPEKLSSWVATLKRDEDKFQLLMRQGKKDSALKLNVANPLLSMFYDSSDGEWYSMTRRKLQSRQAKINSIKAKYNRLEETSPEVLGMSEAVKKQYLEFHTEQMNREAQEGLDWLEYIQESSRGAK